MTTDTLTAEAHHTCLIDNGQSAAVRADKCAACDAVADRIADTGTPTTWALNLPNVYGETRADALARAERAVANMYDGVADCGGEFCRDYVAEARADVESIREGGVETFSLDGRDEVSWTARADIVESAVGYAETEHATFCER
jgi:hypothetical protein